DQREALDRALTALRKQHPDSYLKSQDEIVAKRFTIRGDIVNTGIKLSCFTGTLTIPRDDIVRVAYKELEMKEVFKVTPQHRDQGGFLVAKSKLRKNQKFTLEPEGTMTYNGQSFGPAGISNHTWNGRSVGALQWRIGSGPWKILASKFEGKAESSGPLQFGVHLFNSNSTGEFKITFRSRKKD
ncbi:MAG: hypothetical protein AAF517_24820, partial [Planctomycetota bacterium]